MSRRKKVKEDRYCNSCGGKLLSRYQQKFCSNKCQREGAYRILVDNWLNKGAKTFKYTMPGYIRRCLFEKYESKCSQCFWAEKNPVTGKIPLEVVHIDGNSENNTESNLRLLCPNCHSLTPFFRNLNKGNGRKWRRELSYYPTGLTLKNSLI